MKKDCTTCKYGYEDERLGIPMCHHPQRFSEDCVDFSMHEEKHLSEESDKSLEEAAEEYFYRNWSDGSLDIKPQVKEDFKAGAEWQKKQMMKEAVEGEVIKTDKHTSVRYKAFYGTDRYFYGIADKQFKPGDKVRIIIVKEENK